MGLITPLRKTSLITETGISRNTGYNGCSTTTFRTPDDALITWTDGAMTTMSETRRGAHSLNIKTKVKIGCWNVRMFSVGKAAQITSEMVRYCIDVLGISFGFGRLGTQTGETIIYVTEVTRSRVSKPLLTFTSTYGTTYKPEK